MIENFTLKISNKETTKEVRIIDQFPILSWSFDAVNIVNTGNNGLIDDISSVDQLSYEIRIDDNDEDLGTDGFIGNFLSTGVVHSPVKQHVYDGAPLERGKKYFGQIIVFDDKNNTTDWQIFEFKYNSLPHVANLKLSPDSPHLEDDLEIRYQFLDLDGDNEKSSFIRWFKNGSHMKQFNNILRVSSEYIEPGDQWMADVIPHDGFEYGFRSRTPVIQISSNAPIASDLFISPVDANDNDILRANYKLENETGDDKSTIRWFVNNSHRSQFKNQEYARPNVKSGDIVQFTVIPNDGITQGDVVSSPRLVISSSDFVIYDVNIDGQEEPMSLMSLRPRISWGVISPDGKDISEISLKIGTAPGSGNILSEILNAQDESYLVPANKLNYGSDYFVSIAAKSENMSEFNNYSISHFRTNGSRWSVDVDNSSGWTIETAFFINTGDNENNFQSINIQDGNKFAEVKIYYNQISLFSGEREIESGSVDFSYERLLTIVGKKENIQIYLDRSLLLDGTGELNKETNEKRLTIESPSGNDNSLELYCSGIAYTTEGDYYPDKDKEFDDLIFHNLAGFRSSEVNNIKGIRNTNSNKNVISINPHEEDRSGQIAQMESGRVNKYPAVNRTFTPINNINLSPDGQFAAIAHSRGLSIFKSYYIFNYDHVTNFSTNEVRPEDNNWTLTQNIGRDIITFDDGLIIK